MAHQTQNLVFEIFVWVFARKMCVDSKRTEYQVENSLGYLEKLNKSNGENPSMLSFTVLKLWTGKLKIWFLRKGQRGISFEIVNIFYSQRQKLAQRVEISLETEFQANRKISTFWLNFSEVRIFGFRADEVVRLKWIQIFRKIALLSNWNFLNKSRRLLIFFWIFYFRIFQKWRRPINMWVDSKRIWRPLWKFFQMTIKLEGIN